MGEVILCAKCGREIHDASKCRKFVSGGPYYETVYICEECYNGDKCLSKNEIKHVDMDDGEIL